MPRNSEDGKICVFCTPAQPKGRFLARYSPNVLPDSHFWQNRLIMYAFRWKNAVEEYIWRISRQKAEFFLRWSTKYRFLDMIWPGCSSERVTSIEAPSHIRRWAGCPPRRSVLTPAASLGKALDFHPSLAEALPLGGVECVIPALPFYSRVREW